LGEGSTDLHTVVLNGSVGLLGRCASPWATLCRLISCRAGPALWAENEAQPSPTSCSCRPGPEKIVLDSCSCRAKKSCYGRAHGPRAKWPSITVVDGFRGRGHRGQKIIKNEDGRQLALSGCRACSLSSSLLWPPVYYLQACVPLLLPLVMLVLCQSCRT
jgi:hypothetical protein